MISNLKSYLSKLTRNRMFRLIFTELINFTMNKWELVVNSKLINLNKANLKGFRHSFMRKSIYFTNLFFKLNRMSKHLTRLVTSINITINSLKLRINFQSLWESNARISCKGSWLEVRINMIGHLISLIIQLSM